MPKTYIPKAYETGFQDFYGREFLVTPSVLIPRPETEQLVDAVLKLTGKPILPGVKATKRQLSKEPLFLDVGTGSGCIATTLALEIPKAKIVALDISDKALSVAKKNAEKFQANIEFLKSDLLESYYGPEPEAIVANLPYVDESWEWLDKKALSAEPELALYSGDSGLALIKKLLKQINSRKWNSYVILEMDPCQQKMAISYAEELGFQNLETTGFSVLLKTISIGR